MVSSKLTFLAINMWCYGLSFWEASRLSSLSFGIKKKTQQRQTLRTFHTNKRHSSGYSNHLPSSPDSHAPHPPLWEDFSLVFAAQPSLNSLSFSPSRQCLPRADSPLSKMPHRFRQISLEFSQWDLLPHSSSPSSASNSFLITSESTTSSPSVFTASLRL